MVTNQYKIMIDTFHPGHYQYLKIFSTAESAQKHHKVALTLDMADKKRGGGGRGERKLVANAQQVFGLDHLYLIKRII